MIFNRTARTRFAAAALGVVLGLSACGGAELPQAQPSSGPVTTLSSGDPFNTIPPEDRSELGSGLAEGDAAMGGGAIDEAPADGTSEGAVPVSDGDTADAADNDAADNNATGGDCLVGSWIFTTTEIDDYYNQLEADGVTFDVTGDVRVELRADGSFTYTPTFGFTMTIDGMAATGQSSGSAVGNYTAVDGVFTMQATEDNTDFSVTFSGISMSASDLGVELVGMSQIGTTYSCQDGVPVFQYQTIDGTHPVSFERA